METSSLENNSSPEEEILNEDADMFDSGGPLGSLIRTSKIHSSKDWHDIVTLLKDTLHSSINTSFVTSEGSRGSHASSREQLTYEVLDRARSEPAKEGLNSTETGDDGELDVGHREIIYPNIYLVLVIGTLAFLILGIFIFATYKAVQRLLKSNGDNQSDDAEAGAAASNSGHEAGAASARGEASVAGTSGTSAQSTNTNNQAGTSGTLTRLANGFRAFQAANLRLSATLRSTASSEGGDKPPPYEEDLPPTYNEALKMSGGDTIAAVSAVMTSCRSSSSSLSTAAAGPSSSQAVAGSTAEHSAPSQPVTPSDETDGKKRTGETSTTVKNSPTSKFNFSVV